MFSEWTDFGLKDTIYKLKLGWLKFTGDSPILPNFPAVKHSRHTVYCTEKTKWQSEANHKFMENPARLLTNTPLCLQPNVKAAKKSLENPLLVNYVHNYLITWL